MSAMAGTADQDTKVFDEVGVVKEQRLDQKKSNGSSWFGLCTRFWGLASGEEDGDSVLREAQKAETNVRPGKCNVGLG